MAAGASCRMATKLASLVPPRPNANTSIAIQTAYSAPLKPAYANSTRRRSRLARTARKMRAVRTSARPETREGRRRSPPADDDVAEEGETLRRQREQPVRVLGEQHAERVVLGQLLDAR